MSYRPILRTLLMTLATMACAREALYALPIDEELPPEEELLEEEPIPEETPPREGEPDPEVAPQEPENVPPAPIDDCDETSDLLYGVDKNDGGLYLFDPLSGTFEFLGIPDCGIFSGTPASMAVARNGIAYIRYSSSTLYAIDLETLACTETHMSVASFGKFGMGYSTLHDDTWQDELFIANRNTLAKLNTDNFQFETIGALPSQSELTGNARGELYGVFPLESPGQIMKLDRMTGEPVSSIVLSVMPAPTSIDTFAFATWDGNFYVFLRLYGMGESTRVYRISPTGATESVSDDTGRNIVGVGVSTCAPTGS